MSTGARATKSVSFSKRCSSRPQRTGIDFDLNHFLKFFIVRDEGVFSASTLLSRIMASSMSPESAPDSTSTNQHFLHTVFPDFDLDLSMQLSSRTCLSVRVVGQMRPQPCSPLRVFIANILCISTINFFELSLEIVELALQIEQIPGAQIFEFAINRCIFILGNELSEGRISFESPSQGRHRFQGQRLMPSAGFISIILLEYPRSDAFQRAAYYKRFRTAARRDIQCLAQGYDGHASVPSSPSAYGVAWPLHHAPHFLSALFKYPPRALKTHRYSRSFYTFLGGATCTNKARQCTGHVFYHLPIQLSCSRSPLIDRSE